MVSSIFTGVVMPQAGMFGVCLYQFDLLLITSGKVKVI